MLYWSFHEYVSRRGLNEAGMLKKHTDRILGRQEEPDAGNKVGSLVGVHAKRHKDAAIAVGTGAAGVTKHAGGLATNLATGNVIGAAGSVWGLISNAINAGSNVFKITKAGLYIVEIRKHMKELRKHLAEAEELDTEAIDAIIDAVFEVDEELFESGEIGERTWAEATKRFAEGLHNGYDDLHNKIFAAVMAQVIREWMERMGGKVESMKDAISRLRGEKQVKLDFLEEPEIAAALAEFEPPEPEKELANHLPERRSQLLRGEPQSEAEFEKKIFSTLGWPNMPRTGDMGYVAYRGHNQGLITIIRGFDYEDFVLDGQRYKYSLQVYLRKNSIRGELKTDTNPSYKIPWGYDAKFEQLPKWDATNRRWIVYADHD